MPAFELARLDLRVGTSKNREPPFIRAYYSSTLTTGPRRLLESFHESVYFTSHLAETSMLIFLGLSIGGAAIAAIAAILLLASGLGTTEVASLAQIGIAAMAFFAAGDILQMALGYRGLKLATDGLLRSCDVIRQESSPSLDEVTNLANEYGIALVQLPVILSPVYIMRPKRIVLTDWATQAYADLKSKNVFTDQDYWSILRPDAERLKNFPSDVKFRVNGFWGPANLGAGQNVNDGYKMKWDSLGSRMAELRLMVAIIRPTAYLCQAYVKTKSTQDYRESLNLQRYINLIQQVRFVHRGYL